MTENQPLFLSILLPKIREKSGTSQSQDVHLHLSPRQHPSHLRTSADRHCLLLIISVLSIICVASGRSGFGTRRPKSIPKVSPKSIPKEMSASSSDQLGQIVSETVSDKQGRILCDRWSFWNRNFSSAE